MLSASFIRIISCCIFACGLLNTAYGQTGVWDKPNEKSKHAKAKLNKGKATAKKWKEHLEKNGLASSLKHQLAIGGKLNSNGWSGSVSYLKRIDKKKLHLFQVSFSEIKHEKQIKQQQKANAFAKAEDSRPYFFGKINNLYTLQIGYGKEHLLLPGVVEDNLSVSFRYHGGLSLAIQKPYYLKLMYYDYTDPNAIPDIREEVYNSSNTERFLNNNNILGASKWGKGLDEIKPIPGLYAEAAFAIEPAKGKYLVQTITLGANAAFYAKELHILAEAKATALQTSVFVGLQLGKRWKGRY